MTSWLGNGRTRAPLLLSLTCLASFALAAPAALAGSESGHSKTIGLVISDWRYALRETTDAKEECPDGLQAGEVDQFRAQGDALEHSRKYGGTFYVRGPNGENAGYNPLVVQDKIPFHELQTKVGYGVNLDGTQDGHATAKTCRHEKFTSPEGQQVDNQMARVVGCVLGYRTGGMMQSFESDEVVTYPVERHLIEITGVHDEMNDPSVQVTIYKGMDRMVRTGDGANYVAFQSQRVDGRFPEFTFKTKGKIVDGVLITDPIPEAVMPRSAEKNVNTRVLRDMVMRLKLQPEGAEGIIAGYEKVSNWYSSHSKLVLAEIGKYSSPGIYRALMRYADGYPDAKTGECGYISATYNVKAVRAIIVQPKNQKHGAQHVAQSSAVHVAQAGE